jgi:hypothetical protein
MTRRPWRARLIRRLLRGTPARDRKDVAIKAVADPRPQRLDDRIPEDTHQLGDAAEPASDPPAADNSSTPGACTVEANVVCRLGRKLYPDIDLGAAGDPDTIDYAVGRLVTEITAIATLPPSSGRHELELRGQAAVAAWRSLATRPAETVTLGDEQGAARTATRSVDQLVALGATACAPPRLRTT